MGTVASSHAEDNFSGISQDNLRDIQKLQEGKYREVGHTGPLAEKFRALAAQLETEAADQLTDMVHLSMISARGSAELATMTRHVHEVENRVSSVAAAADELVASVDEISRAAQTASDDADAARRESEHGQKAAEQTVETMKKIADVVTETSDAVSGLAEGSRQVGTIARQIEAIARQTNLLALNAAIEAARAGSAGAGFAVVAGEVKSLAQETAKATHDIRARIEGLQREMSKIVQAMQATGRVVNEGREVITESAEGMARMAQASESVRHRINEVSQILGQQSSAASEVSKAIGQVSRMAKDNLLGIQNTTQTLGQFGPIVRAAMEKKAPCVPCATLQLAKADHMAWRQKVAEMIAGGGAVDPAVIGDHHGCRLGRWYDQMNEPEIAQSQAFASLNEFHQKLHSAGARSARAYRSGQVEQAVADFQILVQASDKVVDCLDQIHAHAQRLDNR